ncbi:AhpD family alkylhydroperoxidase [Labedaea rhizosphaerae]|uniref:AhpD family alkylhydroperoxidase n=2 Tax=Labedaea rhizosphaerae TaxID=598644 RepID=A0A4V3CYG0_LABRH|nr:carboxymuconolactone decarboxylase family protein [Labedaea rhizosphaerae]TDP94008.1 AhpD family alkylhydroperoxidase [Labedaea rhizosphaerae]
MTARMKNPLMVLPEAMKATIALAMTAENGSVPKSTLNLVVLRASQINGCGVCVDMHAKDMRKEGEPDERIFGVAGWRDTPYYSDAERAALELTEYVTRIADKSDPVPDAIWAKAEEHYDEKGLSSLLVAIGAINVFNRINATTRQLAGKY